MRGVWISLLTAAILCSTACASEPVNFAAAANGGKVTGPANCSAMAGAAPVANDGEFRGFAWAFLDAPMVMEFARPERIDTVEMLLYGPGSRWYRYRVEVSADGGEWRQVAQRTDGRPRGWQSVAFDPVECRKVRVTFTDTNVQARSYHVVEVGAFLLGDGAGASPLRKAWEEMDARDRATNYEILLTYLGDEARMTEAEVAEALALDGEAVVRDLDGDGDADIADFVDKAPRHTVQPMLVRVVDDDDDMGSDGKGDTDSDLYIADWRGDGIVDRAVDFWDEDGDGDADRMDIYYPPNTWHGGNVEVVVIRDIGDDDRMWYTRNYEYQQGPCQWQSDFNGDEAFCMFYYDRSTRQFVPHLEAPFTHHDLDGDGVAEFTIQFLGRGQTLRSIRYSFDADNDSHPIYRRRDYDFALDCVGTLPVPEEKSVSDLLRTGERTGRWLDWRYARDLAEGGEWKSCRLCWDEVDNNVNPASKYEREHERWEGVGGYPMREGNKRWETDEDYSGKMQLYYWPVDGRLHLLGAESGFVNIDYDHNYTVDARLTYRDEDGDGYFDLWAYDANNDGQPEREDRVGQDGVELVPIDYAAFTRRYRGMVQRGLEGNRKVIGQLRRLVGDGAVVSAEEWWNGPRVDGFYAGEKLGASAEARRYYQDIIREELYLLAREKYLGAAWWGEFSGLYARGRHEQAAAVLTGIPGHGRSDKGAGE